MLQLGTSILRDIPVGMMFQKIIHDGLVGNGFLRNFTTTYDLALADDLRTGRLEARLGQLALPKCLLLRGAVAASGHDDRSKALQLLAEAEDASRRLGSDRNLRWTAFGPTNTRLHRVNISLALGDAGTALDVARTVDLSSVIVTERKAIFLTDAARAYLQCGQHERAYFALRSAEQIAPEEIAGRRAARDIVMALITTGPSTVQRQASEFGHRIGAAL